MEFELGLAWLLLLLASALFFGVGCAVYFQNRRNQVNRLFAVYLLLISFWALASFCYVGLERGTYILLPVQMSAASFLGVIFFFFSRTLVGGSTSWRKRDLLWLLPGVYLLLFNVLRLTVPSLNLQMRADIRVVDHQLHRQVGFHYLLYSVYLLGGHLAGMWCLARGLRRALPQDRARIRNVLVLTALGFGGVFICINVLNVLELYPYKILSVIPLNVALVIASFSVMSSDAWRIEHLLGIVRRSEEELRDLNRKLTEAARTDGLTNLGNRAELYRQLEVELRRAARYPRGEEGASQFSLMFIDLDNFKHYNDVYGHLVGDTVLLEFARLLNGVARQTDMLFRFGGDEFIIILPNTAADQAATLACRIIDALAQRKQFATALEARLNKPVQILDEHRLGCSIGIVEYRTGDPVDPDLLVRRGDTAMYAAKRAGKHGYMLWQDSGNADGG